MMPREKLIPRNRKKKAVRAWSILENLRAFFIPKCTGME
jgi:hypothetical protein